ncbi:MAG TPA: S8 family serine peptidase [Nevskiaceae bacterium]|nr:S8 family serine peptidase [Nevskiaceae bacterium]
MSRSLAVAGLVVSTVLLPLPAQAAARIAPTLLEQLSTARAGVPLQVIVTFEGKAPLRKPQLDALRALGVEGFHLSRLPMAGVLATPEQVRQIARLDGVRSVYPNSRLSYEDAEANVMTSVTQAQAEPLLRGPGDLAYDGTGITVLVNDSGVDGTHPDLKYPTKVLQNALAHGSLLNDLSGIKLFKPIEGVPNTDAGGSHGTHVAGIVAGDGTASDGLFKGAGAGASLIGYGSGAVLFVLDSLGGFDYALKIVDEHPEYNLRVVTNSFGNTGDVGTPFDPEDPTNIATKLLVDRGLIVVFSSGNSGSGQDTITGNFKKAPWVITVGNGDKAGLLAASSSRGKIAGGDYDVVVDGETFRVHERPTVVAPGTEIISARAAAADPFTPLDTQHDIELGDIPAAQLPYYTHKSGTSMAAPHVAGLVAVLLQANPALTWREVKPILERTATNMIGYQPWQTGAGYANVEAALARVLGLREDYGRTVNVLRTFHSNVTVGGSTDAVHDIAFQPVGPTGEAQFEVGEDVALVTASWVQPLGNLCTCAVVLIDPDGNTYGSSIALPELGSAVGTSAAAIPGTWRVTMRGIGSVSGVPLDPLSVTNGIAGVGTASVHVSQFLKGSESGLADVAGHPLESYIKTAVANRLADGRASGRFAPNVAITRGEMAEYLVSGFGVRQARPLDGQVLYTDVTARQRPFAEMVSATGALIHTLDTDAKPALSGNLATRKFRPEDTVTREAAAYAVVQALGLQAAAEAFEGDLVYTTGTGQQVAIADQDQVAPALRGYVQKALELNLIEPVLTTTSTTTIATFHPARALKRGQWAQAAVRASTFQQARTVDE